MLTIHAAESSPEAAVAVEGAYVLGVGSLTELAAAHPRARIRQWPGILTPGLLNPYGPELLEQTYHPDPREADELGTEPISDPAALVALGMDETRWGASARRGVQRLLAHGTVAVAGELRRGAVLAAVRRVGIVVAGRARVPAGAPSFELCPAEPDGAGGQGRILMPPRLNPGMAARFAVFDVPDADALVERGAATCVATVIGGRLVYRRR